MNIFSRCMTFFPQCMTSFSCNEWLFFPMMHDIFFAMLNLSCNAWHFLCNAWISFSRGMSQFPVVHVIFPAMHEYLLTMQDFFFLLCQNSFLLMSSLVPNKDSVSSSSTLIFCMPLDSDILSMDNIVKMTLKVGIPSQITWPSR